MFVDRAFRASRPSQPRAGKRSDTSVAEPRWVIRSERPLAVIPQLAAVGDQSAPAVVYKVAALGAVAEVGVHQDGLVSVLVRVNRSVRTRLRGEAW